MKPSNEVSNYHWRDFISSYDVPNSELDDNIEAGSQWLKYRGVWYALTDFNRARDILIDGTYQNRTFAGGYEYWHGYYIGSVWHCVAIRLSEDGKQYQIATITR